MPFIINDSSAMIDTVPKALIELKPHQKAIVQKCMDMETSLFQQIHEMRQKNNAQFKEDIRDISPFGVLGTSVGSGKTYCMISLCLIEKYRKKNWIDKLFSHQTSMGTMIVVPSHLYYHWVTAFRDFAGDALSVEPFDDYESIMKLYSDDRQEIMQSSDVYLVSSLYYQTVATTMNTMRLSFKRIIFDEIDSIDSFLHNSVVGAYTWFMSGSVKNILKSQSLFKFGHSSLSTQSLLDNFIDCDGDYIQKSFGLPPYEFHTIHCDNPYMEALTQVLSPEYQKSIYALNACDPQTALVQLGQEAKASLPNDKKFIELIIKRWNDTRQATEEYIACLEKKKQSQIKHETIQKLHVEINNKQNELSFLTQKAEQLEKLLADITVEQDIRPKIIKLTNIILKNTKMKILLYCEYARVFNDVAKILDEYEIGYVDFEGGNNEEMEKAIRAFKENPHTNIFMTHSTLFSCGMNLENTDIIIFLHRVRPEIQQQVIGRGQRPGREKELKVFELLYKNEKRIKPTDLKK